MRLGASCHFVPEVLLHKMTTGDTGLEAGLQFDCTLELGWHLYYCSRIPNNTQYYFSLLLVFSKTPYITEESSPVLTILALEGCIPWDARRAALLDRVQEQAWHSLPTGKGCVHARNVGSGGMGPSEDPHSSGEIPAFPTTMGIPVRSHTARSDVSRMNV